MKKLTSDLNPVSPRDAAVGAAITDATTKQRIRAWRGGSKTKADRPTIAELGRHGCAVVDLKLLDAMLAVLDAWTGYVGDEETVGDDCIDPVADAIGTLRDLWNGAAR